MPATPLLLDLPAKGWKNVEVRLPVPERFGPYAVVVDAGKLGRRFGTGFVRSPAPVPGKLQFPTFSHDLMTWDVTESSLALFQRAGIKGLRMEWSYSPTTGKNHAADMEKLGALLKQYGDHDITVMLTLDGGGPQPLGMFRPHLDADGVMLPGKADYAWLPEYDADYQKWVEEIAARFGWPKGPVNAIELWNEPWEGKSIAGWQADIPRYRDIFTRMAQGIEAARRKAGVQVLIGGACATMNTDDKLFCDGSETFLKWLDFSSIHYQPLSAWHVLVPKFRARKSPFGPVRIWDTESWVANTPDRIPGVLASLRAQGLERTAGVLHPVTYAVQSNVVRSAEGSEKVRVTHAWANVAAIAAFQANVGARNFREILFKGGLPWVFVFDGLKNPDDGAAVVLGDLARAVRTRPDALPQRPARRPARRGRGLASETRRLARRRAGRGAKSDPARHGPRRHVAQRHAEAGQSGRAVPALRHLRQRCSAPQRRQHDPLGRPRLGPPQRRLGRLVRGAADGAARRNPRLRAGDDPPPRFHGADRAAPDVGHHVAQSLQPPACRPRHGGRPRPGTRIGVAPPRARGARGNGRTFHRPSRRGERRQRVSRNAHR